MASNPEQRERLHEQASAHYLQGDYDQAKATWRRLLATDPSDQRAADGVRLCEMADDDPSAAEGPPRPLDPAGEADRTLEQLDAALGGFDLSDPETPPGVEVAPVRFDVEVPEAMNVDAPGVDPDALRLDLDDLSLPEPDDVVSSGASGASGAAAELERRANELMAEAMQLYERGDRQEALLTLNRLAILDEENEAARTFAEHIRAEIEGGVPEVGNPDPAASIDEPPPLVGVNVPPPVTASAPAAPVPDPLPELLDAAPEADPFAASDDPGLAAGGRRTKAKLDVPAPRTVPKRPLLIVGGLAVVAVAAFVFLRSGGDSAGDDASFDAAAVDTTQHAGLAAAGGSPSPRGKAAAEPAAEPAGPQPAAANAPKADVEALLERGRAAFENGDYAAAVVAYNEVLTVDAANGEARERLQEAGDRYREEKAADQGRADAIAAFGRGEYVEALRLFYRVKPTDDEDRARITHYLRNGWYNLGIHSLRTGDCKTARDHFREAKQQDPEDPGVRQGLSLSAKCSKSTLSTEEYETVRAMTPRGLED